jgi:hypothetical protein
MPKGRITEQLVVQSLSSIYGVGLWSGSGQLWHSTVIWSGLHFAGWQWSGVKNNISDT